MDGKWNLPDGYPDTGMLPSEIAVNGVKKNQDSMLSQREFLV